MAACNLSACDGDNGLPAYVLLANMQDCLSVRLRSYPVCPGAVVKLWAFLTAAEFNTSRPHKLLLPKAYHSDLCLYSSQTRPVC